MYEEMYLLLVHVVDKILFGFELPGHLLGRNHVERTLLVLSNLVRIHSYKIDNIVQTRRQNINKDSINMQFSQTVREIFPRHHRFGQKCADGLSF